MKQWRPFLRSPPSLRSPCSPTACLMHAGTSCGRCLWRRSGGPLQTFCSATHSSRASSDARGPPPMPVRPPWPRRLPSTPACPCPQDPPLTILLPPGSRAQCRSNLLPCLPITSVCLVRTTLQVAQPRSATERGQVDCARPQRSPRHCSVVPPEGKRQEST